MDPLDFLGIAKKLLKYNSEANWRTSIGRSYYAVYNYLSKQLREIGIRTPIGISGHGELVKCLRGSEIKEAVDIGSKVDDLRTERIKADYYMDQAINSQTATLLFKKAEKISHSYSSIDQNALKKGIDSYISRIGGQQLPSS